VVESAGMGIEVRMMSMATDAANMSNYKELPESLKDDNMDSGDTSIYKIIESNFNNSNN
jgi:hypothetical protein